MAIFHSTFQLNRLSTMSQLIKSYLDGDQTACIYLLGCRYYQQQIKQIAYKHTKGTSIAWEDAAQAAHEKVFIALKKKKFQPEKGEFYPWAITVAKFAIIDLIRHENRRNHESLDQNFCGKDYILLDTIADNFDLLDALEQAELILKVRQVVKAIAQRYPQRKYLKLWQGKIQGKTQTQLAEDLDITQSAVSKRWKELTTRIAEVLSLFYLRK